jgi:hypothetical protein
VSLHSQGRLRVMMTYHQACEINNFASRLCMNYHVPIPSVLGRMSLSVSMVSYDGVWYSMLVWCSVVWRVDA